MANLRPLKRLERIQTELRKVLTHMVLHSGVSKGQEASIENEAMAICETAAHLLDFVKPPRGKRASIERKVRKALGYTYP